MLLAEATVAEAGAPLVADGEDTDIGGDNAGYPRYIPKGNQMEDDDDDGLILPDRELVIVVGVVAVSSAPSLCSGYGGQGVA